MYEWLGKRRGGIENPLYDRAMKLLSGRILPSEPSVNERLIFMGILERRAELPSLVS